MDGRWRRLLLCAALAHCLFTAQTWADEESDEADPTTTTLKKVDPAIAAAKPAEPVRTGAVQLEGHHLDVKLNTPCMPFCGPPVNDGSEVYDHNMHRAGYPQKVACWAVPSETCAYVGYPVGGGCPFH